MILKCKKCNFREDFCECSFEEIGMLSPKEAKELIRIARDKGFVPANHVSCEVVTIGMLETILKSFTEYDECTPCYSYTSCKDVNRGHKCEYFMGSE